jgi:hypothetical protein
VSGALGQCDVHVPQAEERLASGSRVAGDAPAVAPEQPMAPS